MEEHSYVSCIKINGIPILPPMITKDIRQEMSNYKESAINIEKKLAVLRAAKKSNNYDIYKENVRNKSKDVQLRKKNYRFKEDLVPVESRNGNFNETDVPVEISENLQYSKRLDTKYKLENQTNLTSNTMLRSELVSVTNSTDHYLNETVSKKPEVEVVSNAWKPQVPKTLNIIPLTLSDSNCRRNEEYQESGSDNTEDTPKLVRQGSYVLDAPSPILLAHMQMKLASPTCTPCSEYMPTSYANTVCRKEWKIAQGKIEWEHEAKNKEPFPAASLTGLSTQTRSTSCNRGRAMRKSVSLQAKPKSLSASTYSSARSVDCIQTMLAQEHMNRSNIEINYDKKYNVNSSNEKMPKFQRWKRCNNFSTFNSTYRFGGSLENLDNSSGFSKFTEGQYNNISTKNNLTIDPAFQLKSSTASDKLLTVYKKVQVMHKKQMAELMSRQQKEQTLLQQEFEKQQFLLLTEIRKSFPELSVSLLSENILSPAFNQSENNNEKFFEHIDNNMKSTKILESNLQQENRVEHLQDDSTKMVQCPVDYIYSEINHCTESCTVKDSRSTEPLITKPSYKIDNFTSEKKESEIHTHNAKSYENELTKEMNSSKRSNVSRELFPLDSKTIHVPIIERTMYGTKHIEAVNIINAYARGYLVRRMMRTERVIALKNTYKEALHCMLKLHVDAPLNRSEFNFLQRLQLQCDAASMNIVELFAQSPVKRMQIIAQDREIKQFRIERPTSARSYSFATQRTLARKKLKEMEEYQPASFVRTCLSTRSRCQTWTSDVKERLISPNILYHSIKRSTSAGTVRKPWR
ncbi:uncharacterized protein LOC117601788 isoform X1 [Osmia lignaria lignaria]|uniref:uncharacterized protein LOC117601788 isoform X1 n=1 Tax=Osmia lignaria lignaria TaxID=1437193 RepID=UPI00402BAA07